MTEFTIQELNSRDETEFVDAVGEVYEESPWVAERAAPERPFDSLDDLLTAMERAVDEASHERKIALLRAHPDLGEQTEMTEASREEQAAAGLDELSPEQYETFQRLNETYRENFEFPFIMAVADTSPDEIQAAMEERIGNPDMVEFETALDEVHTIARLRLEDLVSS